MAGQFRYGDFVREVTVNQHYLSYNEVTPAASYDAEGREVPYRPPALRLRSIDVYRLLQPYMAVRLKDQLRAVIPLVLYLVLFQILILRQPVTSSWVLTGGIVAVIFGLMLFMEGLRLGLMPLAELIGNTLPRKSSLPMVMLIAFLLGIGVTLAEPAIGALQAVGSIVDPREAPYLYALLNQWTTSLVVCVGVGVGLAAVLGTLRFLRGWSLKPLIILALTPTIALTLYMATDPDLATVLGLAWDSGAVTTGPVTVPIVLALGIGITAAAGRGTSALSGFGVVTLASVFPILAVLLLALFVHATTSPSEIIAVAQGAAETTETPWYSRTPAAEILAGARAIVPLVAFLLLVLGVIVREQLSHKLYVYTGLVFTLLGMIVFGIGLSYGLAKLGGQSGGLVPAAFTPLDAITGSPLYGEFLGISVVILFAWVLGFGATLAEPALNALGLTVENLTSGALPKRLLMLAVSVGVGFGISLGILKIVFDWQLAAMLVPMYVAAVVLTVLSSEEFVNVAWDSAGVTTGPVTVPLVLAMGLGFGSALDVVEGFGILSMASICPILSVLMTGLWIRLQTWRQTSAMLQEEQEAVQP